MFFSDSDDVFIDIRKNDIGLMVSVENCFYYFIRNNFSIRYYDEALIIRNNFFDNVFLKIG